MTRNWLESASPAPGTVRQVRRCRLSHLPAGAGHQVMSSAGRRGGRADVHGTHRDVFLSRPSRRRRRASSCCCPSSSPSVSRTTLRAPASPSGRRPLTTASNMAVSPRAVQLQLVEADLTFARSWSASTAVAAVSRRSPGPPARPVGNAARNEAAADLAAVELVVAHAPAVVDCEHGDPRGVVSARERLRRRGYRLICDPNRHRVRVDCAIGSRSAWKTIRSAARVTLRPR